MQVVKTPEVCHLTCTPWCPLQTEAAAAAAMAAAMAAKAMAATAMAAALATAMSATAMLAAVAAVAARRNRDGQQDIGF